MNREYLIRCRKEMGYNQAELADLLGITDSVVSHWEVGRKNPKVSTLIELCKLLNMDANVLLNLKGE